MERGGSSLLLRPFAITVSDVVDADGDEDCGDDNEDKYLVKLQ